MSASGFERGTPEAQTGQTNNNKQTTQRGSQSILSLRYSASSMATMCSDALSGKMRPSFACNRQQGDRVRTERSKPGRIGERTPERARPGSNAARQPQHVTQVATDDTKGRQRRSKQQESKQTVVFCTSHLSRANNTVSSIDSYSRK